MTPELKSYIETNVQLLREENFLKLFDGLSLLDQSQLAQLLYQNKINYVPKLFNENGFVTNAMFPKSMHDLDVPHWENAVYMENRDLGTKLENILIQNLERKNGMIIFAAQSLKKVVIESYEGTTIPSSFIQDCPALKFVWLPKEVKTINSQAFKDVSDNILIVTPWRENYAQRLRILQEEQEWYRAHLKFSHKDHYEEGMF